MLFTLAVLLSQSFASPILRPDPAFFSQISDFQADWCTQRVSGLATEGKVCVGKSLFRDVQRVRSVLLVQNGKPALYIEDEWPSVELLKPTFGLIGPVNSPVGFETGSASLFINALGEDEMIQVSLPSVGGTIRAWRAQGENRAPAIDGPPVYSSVK